MANLNLSGFKKLKEDKKTVTMAHPTGHSITILKSKISPLQRKQLEKLPVHLADGGDVEDDATPAPSQDVDHSSEVHTPESPIKQQVIAPDQLENDEYQANPASQPETASTQQKSAAPDVSSPVDVNKSYQQGQKAISEQQDVASQLAKNQADVQQNDIDARKELNETFAQNTKDFQAHQQQFLDDYKNNHIDPKHYQENMSTGSKIATAIGLLIGGFTGGFNGSGRNPAADWLNAQISRDIEAQKSRLDQQKTVLGANQELYHDSLLANNATRANMNDIYDHQIQLAATKLGTPQAKAAADAQHAKFAMENAALLQQNAIRATALKAIQRGGAGLDPLTLGQAGFMSPEEAQKEQGSFAAHKMAVDRVNDLYAQANKEQVGGNLFSLQSYKRADAINSQLIDTFMSTDTAKRYSPESAKVLLAPNLIKTNDDKDTAALKQTNFLHKLQAQAASDMPNFSRYAPNALPKYEIPKIPPKAGDMPNFSKYAPNALPQYKIPVEPPKAGDIVYVKGRKGQVLPDGSIKAI